jgi:hypothetical protein
VEWIEHGEPVEAAAATEDGKTRVGDPTTLADGRAGWAIEVNGSDITVWLSTDEEIGPVQRDALSS